MLRPGGASLKEGPEAHRLDFGRLRAARTRPAVIPLAFLAGILVGVVLWEHFRPVDLLTHSDVSAGEAQCKARIEGYRQEREERLATYHRNVKLDPARVLRPVFAWSREAQR